MSIDFIRPEVDELRPRISVIGVGGAGGNAIANMIGADVGGRFHRRQHRRAGAQRIARRPPDPARPQDHPGLGAGSRPEIGRAAAEETIEEIDDASKAPTCASSPPAWAAAPAPAPRR